MTRQHHVALALHAAALASQHAKRFDVEKVQRGARYHAPTRVTPEPQGGRSAGSHPLPRSRTDVAFHRAAGRHGDADRIARSLVKRERKNARRLTLAIGGA